MKNLDLRKKLDDICTDINAIEQLRLIKELQGLYFHSIVAINSAAALHTYTCAMYAFNFICKADYVRIVLRHPDVFAGKSFMNWLLSNQLLKEKLLDYLTDGDYVIYLDNERFFKHIGIWVGDGLVHSKWGTLGLYEHPLSEVPNQYGCNVLYFGRIAEGVALESFFQYAKTQGVIL